MCVNDFQHLERQARAAALAGSSVAFLSRLRRVRDSSDTGSTVVPPPAATRRAPSAASGDPGGGDNALIRKTLDAVFTSGDPTAA